MQNLVDSNRNYQQTVMGAGFYICLKLYGKPNKCLKRQKYKTLALKSSVWDALVLVCHHKY